MKKEKTKKCAHTVSYFDRNLGYIKCQFCGQRVDDIKMGKSKKAEPYKKRPAKKPKTNVDRKPAAKMGWEQQDPRIGQAEKLKRERNALEVKLKKEKDPARHAELEVALGHIVSEMRDLQKTYEE